jgi:hypothetical protein
MLKKIGATLLCASSLLCAPLGFATTEHILKQGLAADYDFPPNEPQIFSNIFFWPMTASCRVTSNTPDHYMDIRMLHKTGSFNGVSLNEGDVTGAMTQPGLVLTIRADSGARVELINRGSQTIKASCTVVG